MFKQKMISTASAALLFLSTGVGALAQAPPAGLPATEPATQPTTAPGPAAMPKDTLKDLMVDIQAGDAEGFVSCFDHLTDEQNKTLKTIAHVLGTATDLKKAVADKFGKAAGDKIIAEFGGQAIQTDNQIDAMPLTITGEKADLGKGDGILHLVKVGDVWKLVPDAGSIAKAGPIFDGVDQHLDAVKSLIADVKGGKYASFDDVNGAIEDIFQPNAGNGQ